MFRQTKLFLISSLVVIISFALSGCKSSLWQSQDAPASPVNPAPQVISPSPVLADGTRTTYADIVDRVTPAVVKVSVEHKLKANEQPPQNPFGNDFFKNFPGAPQMPQGERRPRIKRGLGSGVIVSADGTILTNHHVIEGADKIKIEMNDKRTFDAKVVGSDKLSDLAVLKIEAQNLPYLNLGNSDQVRVGDIVLAIGNPLGIGQTVTAGIISAKGRRTGLSDGSFEDFLQTDAPINHGNSGGALVSLNGELIGINSQILSGSPSGGSIGIGFSIPSNMAKPVMEQLLKDGKVRRGQLGVIIQNITEELAKTFDLKDTKGVLVSDVKQGSAADKAGIKRGDVITAVNGERIEDSNILRNKVAGTPPGSQITLTILRDGKEQEVKATLDELNSETLRGENRGEQNDGQGKSDENSKLGLDLLPLTPEMTKRLGLSSDTKGLVVTDVDPSASAAEAGINKGDVILEINRQPVETFDQVKSALDKAGDKSSLLLIARAGKTFYVTVEPN